MKESTKQLLWHIGAFLSGALVSISIAASVYLATSTGRTTEATTPVAEVTKHKREAYDPNTALHLDNYSENWLYWYKPSSDRTYQLAPNSSTSNINLSQDDFFYMENQDGERVGFEILTEGEQSYLGSQAYFGDIEQSLYSNSLEFYENSASVTLNVKGLSPYYNYNKQGQTRAFYSLAITTEFGNPNGQYIIKKVPMYEETTIDLIELDRLANFSANYYLFYICDDNASLFNTESFRTANRLNFYLNNSENQYQYGDFSWYTPESQAFLITQTRNAKYFTNNLSFPIKVGTDGLTDQYPIGYTCEMAYYSTSTTYIADYIFTLRTNGRDYEATKVRAENEVGYIYRLEIATGYNIEAVITDANTLGGVFGLIGTAFTSLLPILSIEFMGFPILTFLLIPFTFGLIVMIVKLIKK